MDSEDDAESLVASSPRCRGRVVGDDDELEEEQEDTRDTWGLRDPLGMTFNSPLMEATTTDIIEKVHTDAYPSLACHPPRSSWPLIMLRAAVCRLTDPIRAADLALSILNTVRRPAVGGSDRVVAHAPAGFG